MSGGGYGQQQYGQQPIDGFGGGKGYSLTPQQPTPMQTAFAPTTGMGGPMPGVGDQTGMTQDLSGKGWGAPMPPQGMDAGSGGGVPGPDGFGGGPGYSLTGGMGGGEMRRELDMPQPYAAQGIINESINRTTQPISTQGQLDGAMYRSSNGMMGAPQLDGLGGFDPRTGTMGGAMAKQGGGIMGGPMPGGGMAQPTGGYQDYMNRRNSWIDQLRGYVAQPQKIGQGQPPTWGGQPGPGNPPVTSAPPGGPAPGPKAAGGGVDHMANLKALMGQDPRLANEYRLRSGDTINWWQQNQGNVAQGLFGGDNNKMQEWLRGSSPTSSNAAPLSQEEMMRLNQMAGIRGPSWMR